MPTGIYLRTDYHREIARKTNWCKGTKGVIKPNLGSFKVGHRLGMTSKKHSQKTKEKMKISNVLGNYGFEKRHIPWNKGTKGLMPIPWLKLHPEYAHRGENHPNWQGGKSYEIYPLGWNKTYKEQIRRRDEYKCQICGIPEMECSRKLHVHHKDFNKKNIELNNLISLCQSCHIKLHWRAKDSR